MTKETNLVERVAAEDVAALPLHRLKRSPDNARKTPHSAATLEALAASIDAKGLLQPLVVAPERDDAGAPTGSYLVTIGEGRRQALTMLRKRKRIRRDHPVLCRIDEASAALEISLDENVTREAMHPADQVEAFLALSRAGGLSPEDIARRFGLSVQLVRQRLRLGAVAPEVMTAYRSGALSLDQVAAFAVSQDHQRQRQVLDQLPHASASPYAIRRAMTETAVEASDRRARFVGREAYEAQGGTVLKDLFSEDDGGWFEDAALLERIVLDKLKALAEAAREREGWAWAEAHIDFPYGQSLGRLYPRPVERSDEDLARIGALRDAYDALVASGEDDTPFPPEVEAELDRLDAELQAFGPDDAYRPEDLELSGLIVCLGYDGVARWERGLVRAQDAAREMETTRLAAMAPQTSDEDAASDAAGERTPVDHVLPDKLVRELTAYRGLALGSALVERPRIALVGVVHALALQVFYPPWGARSPLRLVLSSPDLARIAPDRAKSPIIQAQRARRDAWRARLPKDGADLFEAVLALEQDDLLELLAVCLMGSVDVIRDGAGQARASDPAEDLAKALDFDMADHWTADVESYFGKVSRGLCLAAVGEACGEAERAKLAGLRKTELGEAAAARLEGGRWLPPVLRSSNPPAPEPEAAAPPAATGAVAA